MFEEYYDRVPVVYEDPASDGNETDDSDIIMKKVVAVKDELKSYCDNVTNYLIFRMTISCKESYLRTIASRFLTGGSNTNTSTQN